MNWYEKYLSIYEKPFSEVPQEIIDKTHDQLAALQSDNPLISIIIVAYNEEKRLQACLWSLSETKCKYPVEFIGVDNESKDRTAEIYQKSGIPFYTEHQHTCGYARQCGLNQAKGKYCGVFIPTRSIPVFSSRCMSLFVIFIFVSRTSIDLS